jgi:hypothetical protein
MPKLADPDFVAGRGFMTWSGDETGLTSGAKTSGTKNRFVHFGQRQ